MIAPTYTHPGVNRLLLELSQVERKARLARRAMREAKPGTSRRVQEMFAKNYEAIAHCIRRQLGASSAFWPLP